MIHTDINDDIDKAELTGEQITLNTAQQTNIKEIPQ